ncbi:MAG: hypothetical protein ACW99Q_30200, partial [Candidatus Kariarchaeaceae archaeon]
LNGLINDGSDDIGNDGLANLTELNFGSSKDIDGDGLTNFQEFIFGSWSNSSDSDKDGIDDLYEYQMSEMISCIIFLEGGCQSYNYLQFYSSSIQGWDYDGLEPLINDSFTDKDDDKMPNLWEYQMGLDASSHLDGGWNLTELNDKDQDGLPNFVEYINDLNASNSSDGGLILTEFNDKDLDGMPNLWECPISGNIKWDLMLLIPTMLT